MSLKLMYITNKPNVAKIAEKYGVDRIWVDLETRGKYERQKNINSVKSDHVISDVSAIGKVLSKSKLLVRVNPIYEGSKDEIEEVIKRGAEYIMLPMFRTTEEAKMFIQYVGGRVKTILLVETPEAEHKLDEICQLPGIDEIHIGLNDLHLAYGLNFMFELLSNGKVESMMKKIRSYGISCGFGGIARLDEGGVPARCIIAEHYRLGSSMAILSRSFYDSWIQDDEEEIEQAFRYGISEIREYEARLLLKPASFFSENQKTVSTLVNHVVKEMKEKRKSQFAQIVWEQDTIQGDYQTLEHISDTVGDSFYLLDLERFKNNFLNLKETFQENYPNINIAYSYKTNYIPSLCKAVKDLGGYAEVVSELELQLALACGVEYTNIIWNGPVKNKGSLKNFFINGGMINADNLSELEYIDSISKNDSGKIYYIGLRCNFDICDGQVSRFGFDVTEEDYRKAIDRIVHNDNLKLDRLQCHFSIRKPEYWLKRIEEMLELYDDLKNRYGIEVSQIDLGGGIYGQMPKELERQLSEKSVSYDSYSKYLSLIADHFKDSDRLPTVIIEPGTAVVADCMTFVCRVDNIKKVCDRYIATTTGSQKNISMANINPPIDIIRKESMDSIVYEDLYITGYTCIEQDYLYKHYRGKLSKGDFIQIKNCGSYSIVMKPPFIFPNCAVLEMEKGTYRVIKRGETFNDIFATYKF